MRLLYSPPSPPLLPTPTPTPTPTTVAMLYYAVVFLLIALISAALGFGALAGTAATIAKICFVVFLVFALLSFLKKK